MKFTLRESLAPGVDRPPYSMNAKTRRGEVRGEQEEAGQRRKFLSFASPLLRISASIIGHSVLSENLEPIPRLELGGADAPSRTRAFQGAPLPPIARSAGACSRSSGAFGLLSRRRGLLAPGAPRARPPTTSRSRAFAIRACPSRGLVAGPPRAASTPRCGAPRVASRSGERNPFASAAHTHATLEPIRGFEPRGAAAPWEPQH